jgi:antitoxin (DNA-binding transcriptional repressor) of toxin-antitoxin stability system
MASVTLEEAQATLSELIQKLAPGEEVVIVQAGNEVARLAKSSAKHWPCKAGSYRKAEFWMAPDFDAPLDDFKEYME